MHKAKSKLFHAAEAARCPVLDPRTLGRPFHLLDDFCARLSDALGRFFEQRFNRRYDAAFSIGRVAMQGAGEAPRTAPWRSYRSAVGCLSVALERPLLLAALDYRYGGGGAIDPDAAETETEHRLAVMLGQQLLDVLLTCVDPNTPGDNTSGPVRRMPPAPGSQLIRVEVIESVRNVAGVLWLALDEAWLSHLFAGLAPRRAKPAEPPPPMAAGLRLKLDAQLLSTQLPLGELLYLKPGDVLSVRMNERADVLVSGTRLFNAAIAEHDGKLWLTSFEDVE